MASYWFKGSHSATKAVSGLSIRVVPSLHGVGKIANHLAKNDNSLVFLMDWNLFNLVGVISLFAWKVLSMASYFVVLVVLLTMSFRAMPKYFPQLSG